MGRYQHSEKLHAEAKEHIVGGINSPSRTFQGVGGGSPIYMEHAEGAYFWDVDGHRYIDYLGAYGPIIAGHAHPHIKEAIKSAADSGVLYGTPTRLENEFAKMVKDAIPFLDKIRVVNSGTEAVMSTVRVARAYTGRNKIIKFAGSYHGHFDSVLVEAGSGMATLGTPDSAGIPETVARDVITVPFNDLETFRKALQTDSDEVAAVLMEPIVGNFGIVKPEEGFLQAVKEEAHTAGSLLIYDEVITAFRFAYGSSRELHGVEPDMIAMGKIIGGGLPIGAYGARQNIMEQVAPLGPAYQAGTMSGNPASISAGIACLEVLQEEGVYRQLDALGSRLEEGLYREAAKAGITITINRVVGALTMFFAEGDIKDYEDVDNTDGELYAQFFWLMLERGINLAPSKFEAWFLTVAHTENDVDETIKAAGEAFQEMSH